MPRIRTLKPECWQDEKVGGLSRSARLLWIGLITQADDAGRLRSAPQLLKAHLMPYDPDATVEEIQDWLDEVERMGLVKCYRVGGERFAYLPRWSNHQRINRPTPSLIPAPSRPDHGALREPSVSTHHTDLGSWIKDQVQGANAPVDPDDIERVWSAYAAHHPQARLTPERRSLIRRRLDDYAAWVLVDAIDGNHRSAWHCGDNPGGRKYHDLKLILRDGDHIERFSAEASPIEQLAAKRNLSAADIAAVADAMEGGDSSGHITSGEDPLPAARLLPERADAA